MPACVWFAGPTRRRTPRTRGVIAAALAAASLAACAPSTTPERAPRARAGDTVAVAVRVVDDSGRARSLDVVPPAVWIARVTPSSPPPAALAPPLPDVALDSLPPAAPLRLEIDGDLKPPILRRRAPIVLPPGAPPAASVELEIHVDASGRVAEAVWAGGAHDNVWVEAARACALAMEFYPALRAGEPVAVWCRQRFDFPRRR